MRLALLVALLTLAACRSGGPYRPPPVNGTNPPGGGAPAALHVEVRPATAEEAARSAIERPPVVVWTPPAATWVEVRHAGTGRVVWRIEQRGSPHGPGALVPPLVYGAFATPGASPPPDAAAPHIATPPAPLVAGERYAVTVHRASAGPASPAAEGGTVFTR